eukprot:1143713-Pleurochrysis_carterae.AAC.3
MYAACILSGLAYREHGSTGGCRRDCHSGENIAHPVCYYPVCQQQLRVRAIESRAKATRLLGTVAFCQIEAGNSWFRRLCVWRAHEGHAIVCALCDLSGSNVVLHCQHVCVVIGSPMLAHSRI